MLDIYRGVSGTNRKIKKQFRGVSRVNREIKEQWRGLSGVNRKVFNRQIIEQRLIRLENLIGSYEINDFGTYLWARINGKHISGNTNQNKVYCGWGINNLVPGDVAEFTYEFTTIPTGVSYFDLSKGDGATGQLVSINSTSGTATVTVSSSATKAVLDINCGSATTADKSLRITNVKLNGVQIYPL